MSAFKAGDFVVHITGGPVMAVSMEDSNGSFHCERWGTGAFIKEKFEADVLRLATPAEIAAMKAKV